MEWAALIAWVVTAGFGFVMLAIWLSRGGMRQREGGRIRPRFILSHFALGAGGPVAVIALHGLAAVMTVVLVFLTAIGVGGS
jgi:manganese efflux pump family protein